jgi:hypothetical protein
MEFIKIKSNGINFYLTNELSLGVEIEILLMITLSLPWQPVLIYFVFILIW